MRGVIAALILALLFILIFYGISLFEAVSHESAALSEPVRIPDDFVNVEFVTGYPDDLGKISSVEISNLNPESQKMGAVTFRMTLNSYRTFFRSDMSIDLDKLTLIFVSPSESETLLQKSSRPMIKPGWTITKKTGILPFEYADQDNLLEPYESFEILVYPQTPLSPMTRFLIYIQLPSKNQVFISRSVPATITPEMVLIS